MFADTAVASQWTVHALNLDSNGLREQAAKALAPLLSAPRGAAPPCLREISLAKNSIGDRGAAKLLHLLFDNRTLTRLNLADNGLEIYSGKALGTLLIENNTLESLDVSFNR